MEQSRVLHRALLDELEKIRGDLSAQARTQIAKKNFALTSGQSNTGKPAYPIHDLSHARSALRLVGMHGSDQQKSEVRRDVERKYPELRKKTAGLLQNLRKPAATEIAGLGLLAVPGIDTLQAHARARLAGDKTPQGAEKRRFMGDAAHAALDVGGLGVLMRPEFGHLRKQ